MQRQKTLRKILRRVFYLGSQQGYFRSAIETNKKGHPECGMPFSPSLKQRLFFLF